MNQKTKAFVPLSNALAQIERARENLVATVAGLELDADTLGRLASIDEKIASAELEFNTLCIDVAIEENREHAITKQ